MMPGDVPCADWLLLMPCPPARQGGPRTVVYQVRRPAHYQTWLTNRTDSSVESHYQNSGHSAKMSTWRDSVLTAEAKKAGSASEDTRLTPRLPSLTGRLAWVHWMSLRSIYYYYYYYRKLLLTLHTKYYLLCLSINKNTQHWSIIKNTIKDFWNKPPNVVRPK